MKEIKELNRKVINLSDIPRNLIDEFAPWLYNDYANNCYIEVHIDIEDKITLFDQWLMDNYIDIEEESSFLIYKN